MKKSIYFIIVALSTINLFAQQTSKTMDFDGLTRKYIEYVSPLYNSSQSVPLIISLHGLGDNMNNFAGIGMHQIADTANFIVITPEAIVDALITNSTAWNSGASAYGFVLNGNIDDVGFLNAIIDSSMQLYNIDTNRIYVLGLSMGGFMTQRLACQLNERFAAVASVAGTMGTAMTCTNDSPIPVCHIHGTLDSTIYYTNNMYGNDPEEVVNFWVNKNSCDTNADTVFIDNVADGRSVEVINYPNGDLNTEVLFYKIINGKHEWLFTPANDIHYTKEIWKFFSKHTKQYANSVADYKNNNSLDIYPNPAKDILHIDSKKLNITNYTIVDINGKQLYYNSNLRAYSSISINVSNLEQGIYIIKVETDNSDNYIYKKFIVE